MTLVNTKLQNLTQKKRIFQCVSDFLRLCKCQTTGSTDRYGLEAGAKEAFETAVGGLTGVGYRPLMLLSSQLVAGTNYRIICAATKVTAQPASALCLVQVYGALDGTAELTVLGNCNF